MNTTKRVLTILILILSYILLLFCFTHTFDYDLGWHLRFGRDIWQSASFPYQDTYTWAYQGQTWFNHEWGGDWFYWLVYGKLGYFPLLIILSLPPFLAFIWCIKIFKPKIGLADAVIVLLSVHALRHVLVPRLAMFFPLFVVVLWYFLERLPRQKNYYFWPLLFWLWSVLHGSWILGFIIIGIYIGGNILNLLCKKYYPRWYHTDQWNKKEIYTAILWSAISGLAILINPYGWHIWQEVITYFSAGYYKQYITEWVPSYVYPVYAEPLVFMAITLPLALIAWYKKHITWPQILLYLAFWLASFKYKRHALLFFLVAMPLLAIYAKEIKQKLLEVEKIKKIFSDKRTTIFLYSTALICTGLLLAYFALEINITKNIWGEKKLLTDVRMPVQAAEFLKEKTAGQKVLVFNEFNWGGYLEWTVPNALLYLDGRGTVSWMHASNESMLEHYRKIKFEAGGLKELESGPTQYVILEKISSSYYSRPNLINRIIFSDLDFQTIFSTEPPHLEKMLNKSPHWKKIYDDRSGGIWERIKE